MAEQDSAELNKVINEEYKLWKKNAFMLYDTVVTHALDWPTLTLQWLPDKETPADKDYTVHRMLLGTHTSDNERNQLQFATVHLPKPQQDVKEDNYDENKGEIGSHSDIGPRVKITQAINHEGEVNRARYMPQNPDLIATKTITGEVFVFDRTKHPNQPKQGDDACKPNITLRGQSKEGYGIAWNPNDAKKGHILSTSEDMTVCHWDIMQYTKQNTVLEPLATYKAHTATVEDAAWHYSRPEIFASVGDDRRLILWDTRSKPTEPTANIEAHASEINAVTFSPHTENIILTGSSDKTIALWDLRNLSQKLHTFIGHEDEVLQLQFSPHIPTVFASGSSDRRVNIWNMASIGEEQLPEDAEDGPPELLFMHGGHTDQITDLSWNLNDRWSLASSAEDNVLQVWSPAAHVWARDDAPLSPQELE